MKKYLFSVFLTISCLRIMGQVDIKFDMKGMQDNSIIMINALCKCYSKDSVLFWLDSLSYRGVFICEINRMGYVVDIPRYWSNKKYSFKKEDLTKIKKYLQDQKIRFSIIYINEFGENEDYLRKFLKKEVKKYFRHHTTRGVGVGFPGNLSAPFEKYLSETEIESSHL